eukprot:Nitzschia sp. Nitz4//scaffold178_size73299//64727//65782//NITZ4_005720-RA/size73299-processed-gene-0.37-mRNA-1//-1//CDS//3329539185//4814//frame0
MSTTKYQKKSFKGRKVDLTLQTIRGIHSHVGEDEELPELSAVVSFAGSSASMQVSSFTMCSRSGNLIVESQPLQIDELQTVHPNQQSLFANFVDPSFRESISSHSTASSTSHPHLKLRIPEVDTETPKRSLSNANRDSRLVKAEIDGQSTISGECSRGASLHWESDTMPEIVEVHIAIQTKDQVLCREGIAHLMMFPRQQDIGITTMDLLIKKKGIVPPMSEGQKVPMVTWKEDASIRVQVSLRRDERPSPPKPPSAAMNQAKLGEIMSKLNENEEMANAQAMANKLHNGPTNEGMFCSAGRGLNEIFRSMIRIFQCGDSGNQSETTLFMPNLCRATTMDSSIETRDSMMI